eukprot:scaffold118833_cov32-Tisochrysis_lutea.AAC.2
MYFWNGSVPNLTAMLAIFATIFGIVIATISHRQTTGRETGLDMGILIAIFSNLFLQLRNVVNKKLMASPAPTPPLPAKQEIVSAPLVDSLGGVAALGPVEVLLVSTAISLPIQLSIQAIVSGISLMMRIEATPSRYAHYKDAHPLWVLVPPIAFMGYQIASILVLSHVEPVMHALLNAIKRVILIALGALWMHEHVFSVGFICGAILAIVGATSYSFASKVLRQVTSRARLGGVLLVCIALVTLAAFKGLGRTPRSADIKATKLFTRGGHTQAVETSLRLPKLPRGLSMQEALTRGGLSSFAELVWIEGALNLLHPSTIRHPLLNQPKYPLYMALGNILSPKNQTHVNCSDQCIDGYLTAVIKHPKATILGIGVSSNSNFVPTNEIQLRQSDVGLVRALSSRAKHVHVQVGSTVAALHRDGITNVVATGCPSLLLNPNPLLGEHMRAALDELASVAKVRPLKVGMAMYKQWPKTTTKFMLRLLQESTENVVFKQTIRDDVSDAVWEREMGTEAAIVRRIKREQFLYFYDNTAWRARLRQLDIFISGTIHGALMAMSAGLPVLVIPGDVHSHELANSMRLPCVLNVLGNDNLSRLIKKASFDAKAFDAHRRWVAKMYHETLESLGLSMNPQTWALAV